MIFNIFQPLVLLIVIRFGLDKKIRYGGVANLMYFAHLLSSGVWNFADISPDEGCTHLNLRYWDTTRTTLYMLASLISFWDIQDIFWAVLNISIFLIAFFVAMGITSCGVGSLFCWIIFLSGFALVVGFHIRRIQLTIEDTRIIVQYII